MCSYYHEEELKTMTPVIVFNGYDKINIPTWKVGVVSNIYKNIEKCYDKKYLNDVMLKGFKSYYFSEAFDMLFAKYYDELMDVNCSYVCEEDRYIVEIPAYLHIDYEEQPKLYYGLFDKDIKNHYLYQKNIEEYLLNILSSVKMVYYGNKKGLTYDPVITVNNCYPEHEKYDGYYENKKDTTWRVGVLENAESICYLDYFKYPEFWRIKTNDFVVCDSYDEALKNVSNIYDSLLKQQEYDQENNQNYYTVSEPSMLKFIYDRDIDVIDNEDDREMWVVNKLYLGKN